jgi:hypothetical protein
MEGDKSKAWPGIEGERLCQWMVDQLSEKVQREPEEELPLEPWPAAASPVTVEITQVQALQPTQTETPSTIGEAGRAFQGFVRGVTFRA